MAKVYLKPVERIVQTVSHDIAMKVIIGSQKTFAYNAFHDQFA